MKFATWLKENKGGAMKNLKPIRNVMAVLLVGHC
ncbi:MAG: hypothetical protein DDT28_01264 [Dehalococcoidia bacterium]|nr:hypothetical protein [Chloroflexota bacterium]